MPATFRLRRPRPANRNTAVHKFRPGVELLEGLDLPSTLPFTPPLNSFAQEFVGDFNGDSLDDVAAFDEQGRWVVSLSTGSSFEAPDQWSLWAVPGAWRELIVADFNGDGRDDVAGFGASTVEGTWWVGLSDGECSFLTSLWARWSVTSFWDDLFVGDFNGDNRDDVAGFAIDGKWWVGLSNGSDAFLTHPPWAAWANPFVWDSMFVGDFDGNGRDDILGFANSGQWWVGLSDGSAFNTQLPWAQWSDAFVWEGLFVGDFNGDGRDDIAGFAFNGTWWVGLSNATTAFVNGPAWATWALPAEWSRFFVGDFNGDSRSDVACFSVNGDWVVGLSNGTSAFTTSATPWGQWSAPEFWEDLVVGAFSGDSREDVGGFSFEFAWWVGVSNGTNAFVPSRWVDWVE